MIPAPKLAVGYRLDELKNDITRETPASFEPSIDYVVTKIRHFAFGCWHTATIPQADPTLTQMKSVVKPWPSSARSRRACKNASAHWRHGVRAPAPPS